MDVHGKNRVGEGEYIIMMCWSSCLAAQSVHSPLGLRTSGSRQLAPGLRPGARATDVEHVKSQEVGTYQKLVQVHFPQSEDPLIIE